MKDKNKGKNFIKRTQGDPKMVKTIQKVPLIKKPELLDDILQETEELIKILVTSIKTAEKKSRLGVIGRSMFDVHLSKHPRIQTCGVMGCWKNWFPNLDEVSKRI